jgi:S1-C subfamily serine protease
MQDRTALTEGIDAVSSLPGGAGAITLRAAAVVLVVAGGVWWYTRPRAEPRIPAPAAMASPTANAPAAVPAVSPVASPPAAAPVFSATTTPPAANEASVASTPNAASPSTLEDVVSRVSPAVVTIQASSGRGSGFFVASDTILTNVHVVTSDASVSVRRSDGSTTPARVDAQSAPYDIAVLKVSNPVPNQAFIALGSVSTTRVGQEVIAIGTPLGFLETTVSRGIVSALRDVDGATMIQTDAAINPGNSGGPLLDRAGTAIGVIKSGYNGRNGLSFAVAIDHARAVLAGRTASNVISTPSPYQALSPAVASPVDQRRNDGAKAFEQLIAQLARRAEALDARWRNFRNTCYEGRIAGSFDHDWYALWDERAMQGAVSPGCGPIFGEIRETANAIREAVVAAEEAARQADVYPGTRREMLHRYRLDYGAWIK